MIHKQIVPDAQQLGESPVLILKIGKNGLDKTASMQKRASAFALVIANIKPMLKKAYLHVITTGAYLYYGSQRNADAFNLDYMTIYASLPKDNMHKVAKLDGGLKKYHDKSYMQGGHVYQLHQTLSLGAKPSGIVKAAKYNLDMHRGELLILVDALAWRDRLNKRASGQDIYLSIGCDLDHDTCGICLNQAHTLKLHCDHVTMHKNAVYLDGNRACMFNDAPHFYDISGVNVPADPIAFVLNKVASGESAQNSIALSRYMVGTRPAMVMNKAASILGKLANIEKHIICKLDDDPIFLDLPEAVLDFLSGVEKYPADEIISGCNRKGILLSPKMLFKLIGKESNQRLLFDLFADNCPLCGQRIMQDMQEDPQFSNELIDGSFDSILPADLNLDSILLKFMPEFGVTRPALNGKAIRITIRIGNKEDDLKDPLALINNIELSNKLMDLLDKLKLAILKFENPLYENLCLELECLGKGKGKKKCKLCLLLESDLSILKKASLINDLFRRTYARYVLSFAAQNSLDTCKLAMQKVARYK